MWRPRKDGSVSDKAVVGVGGLMAKRSRVAQLAEQVTVSHTAAGSTPAPGASLDEDEYPEAYDGLSKASIEWITTITCYVCGARAPTTIVANGYYSSKLTRLPDGWFCDRGLCDTSAIACSIECARKLSAEPW